MNIPENYFVVLNQKMEVVRSGADAVVLLNEQYPPKEQAPRKKVSEEEAKQAR